jgi:oxygen-dependent protoporphyrinogen oxidase
MTPSSAGSGTPPTTQHVVVVGGGIAGLVAARHLAAEPGLHVTLLEGSPSIGGKLGVSDVGGVPVDEGGEQVLVRRPEARELIEAVGLGDDLVHPAASGAGVWSRGALHPLPTGTVMGVPTELASVAASGLLSRLELARLRAEPWGPGRPLDADVSVGHYVARRAGRAVVDRLVEPLLGGVWAGRADNLSLAATVPQIFAGARRERSLLRAAAASRGPGPAPGTPVFASLRGGLGRLPGAVLADLQRFADVRVRTSAPVRELRRTPSGWRLTVGSARSPEAVDADAVVVAAPARPAARLLADVAPGASGDLAALDYASVGLVTLVFRDADVAALPAGTGFLVPPVEGRIAKAATFATAKWSWYADAFPGAVVVRMSVGRHGDEADLQRDDEDLVRAVRADLADMAGVSAAPVASRVTRWGGALPQYAVGHLDRVVRVRSAVAAQPGLAVCGAAYDGVGVPAVIGSARAAAEQVGAWLRRDGADGRQ